MIQLASPSQAGTRVARFNYSIGMTTIHCSGMHSVQDDIQLRIDGADQTSTSYHTEGILNPPILNISLSVGKA